MRRQLEAWDWVRTHWRSSSAAAWAHSHKQPATFHDVARAPHWRTAACMLLVLQRQAMQAIQPAQRQTKNVALFSAAQASR